MVLSGGQDSTICLYWAKRQFDVVHCVSFDYGQRHRIELKSAKMVAKMANVASHQIIKVPNVLTSCSPLTEPKIGLEHYMDYETMDKIIGDRVELTFVPMRNAFFLTIAANVATSKQCTDLVTGVCQQDNANYPDCRAEFIDSQQHTVNNALGIDQFTIHTPLMDMSKAQSIRLAQTLDGCMKALAYSHTCYAGKYPPCGKCHSCVLRAQGFKEAGVPDPLIERTKHQHWFGNPVMDNFWIRP